MEDKEFREKFKATYDAFSASESLRARVLEQKNTAVRKRRNMRPVIAAVASAAAAVGIFAAVHQYDFHRDDSGVIYEYTAESPQAPDTPMPAVSQEASTKAEESKAVDVQSEKKEKPAKKTTEDYIREALDSLPSVSHTPIATVRPKTNTAAVQPKSVPTAAPAVTMRPASRQGSEDAPEDAKVPAENAAPAAEMRKAAAGAAAPHSGIVLRLNSPALLPVMSGMAESGSIPETVGEYNTEQWDDDRYFSYIGSDVIKNAESTGVLSNTGSSGSYFTVDVNGTPLNDTRIFTFSGSGDVSVITSKQNMYAQTVLDSAGIELSLINGRNAAVFEESGIYTGYMVLEDTSYIIEASGMTEKDFAELLLAITKD